MYVVQKHIVDRIILSLYRGKTQSKVVVTCLHPCPAEQVLTEVSKLLLLNAVLIRDNVIVTITLRTVPSSDANAP